MKNIWYQFPWLGHILRDDKTPGRILGKREKDKPRLIFLKQGIYIYMQNDWEMKIATYDKHHGEEISCFTTSHRAEILL